MKTAILITARLKSTRLPKKALLPIQGRAMIRHMIDRLKLAKRPEEMILCTSPLEQDDPLVQIASEENIKCYRGHPDDVLLRLTDAAREFNVDTVVNCTADNPFLDPVYMDYLVDFHTQRGLDYSSIEGLPFGCFCWALSRQAMERALEIKDSVDSEVWGGYFTQTGLFNWEYLQVTDEALRWPELRLTVDTPEDFELVSKIFEQLYNKGEIFPLADIVALCRQQPELVAINAHICQKTPKPIKLRDYKEK